MINLDRLIPRTDREMREQQKIDRLRECEHLRKERFFNAKNRLMGKDNEALQRQLQEKKMIKQLEKDNDDAFIRKLMNDVQIANSLEERSNEIRKQKLRDIDVYRMSEQRKEQEREYDLNDVKRISHQLPMRIDGINDPRETTMMSFLTFLKEENRVEREKAMKKHLWQGLAKQISENCITKRNAVIEHLQSGQETMRTDAIVNRKMEMEEKARAEGNRRVLEYNMRKAHYEAEKKKLEKRFESDDGVAHINTCLESDFYREDRSVMKSSLGPAKMIPYNHKGMTQEELREIQEDQLKQIEEKKKIKAAEKVYETFWTFDEDMQTRVKRIREMAEEETRRRKTKEMLNENLRLAAEQAIKREESQRRATDNFPSEEYFAYFNSGSR